MGGERKALGAALARVRKRQGMTQTELAAASGIPQVTISRWENGAQPALDELMRVEECLGVARGAVLREAGYVADEPRTAGEVIDSDPTLEDLARALVWSVYRAAQTFSADIRSSTGPPARKRGA